MKTKLIFLAVIVVTVTLTTVQQANAQCTYNCRHIYNSNAGNVGIGTNSPQQKLSINGAMNVDQGNLNNGTIGPGILFGSFSGEGIASKRTAGGNNWGLDFYTNWASRMSITQAGNVGIGTNSPQQKLS